MPRRSATPTWPSTTASAASRPACGSAEGSPASNTHRQSVIASTRSRWWRCSGTAGTRTQTSWSSTRQPPAPLIDTGLGRTFTVVAGHTAFRRALARRITEHNLAHGRPAAATVDASVRAQLRTDLGRETFERQHDRAPNGARELSDFLTTETRRGNPSVAGFDLCFSPVKSVSALWALADSQLAEQIEAAHTAAVQDVISWLEDTSIYTRLGHNGARQVDVNGLLAVAFVHRDSRAADPDLHTHVAISNKVQTSDGRWRALDGRVLYKASVSASERYNTRLEAHLVDRLGVRFADRPGQRDKRPVREIVGMDAGLLQHWSTRRRQIEIQHQELAKTFTEERGRWPDAGEDHELFDRANLDTRPDKHGPRSLTSNVRLGGAKLSRCSARTTRSTRCSPKWPRLRAPSALPADWEALAAAASRRTRCRPATRPGRATTCARRWSGSPGPIASRSPS